MSEELKSVLEDGPIEGEPLVSVCVITYNHGKYIRQCLDGILMQKVNFPYEILIHDDASPDDTADIIREYWAKYPTVIKPMLQTENQYSQGGHVWKFNFERAKAKYIAMCEGDDYWTDERKLQMQVDFLEEHGDYVGTGHSVWIVDENGKQRKGAIYPSIDYAETHVFSLKDVEIGKNASHTASLVYRNLFLSLSNKQIDSYYLCSACGDRKLSALLACNGDIYCFGEKMSCYRFVTNTGTSWSARNKNINRTFASYKATKDIEKMVLDSYDKKIVCDTLGSTEIATIFAIMHPNRTNISIFVQIAQLHGYICTAKHLTTTLFKKYIPMIVRKLNSYISN